MKTHDFPLFYSEDLAEHSEEIILSEEESRHLFLSLRLKEGDFIEVFNGKGIKSAGFIKSGGHKRAEIILDSKIKMDREISISAIIPLFKFTRLEIVLEKLTELGVTDIYFYESEHSSVAGKRYDNKIKRWETIILSAAKQARNYWLPQLFFHKSLLDALIDNQDYQKIVPIEPIRDIIRQNFINLKLISDKIVYIIGPEGGFSEMEIMTLAECGAEFYALAGNILRVETAAILTAGLIRNLTNY